MHRFKALGDGKAQPCNLFIQDKTPSGQKGFDFMSVKFLKV